MATRLPEGPRGGGSGNGRAHPARRRRAVHAATAASSMSSTALANVAGPSTSSRSTPAAASARLRWTIPLQVFLGAAGLPRRTAKETSGWTSWDRAGRGRKPALDLEDLRGQGVGLPAEAESPKPRRGGRGLGMGGGFECAADGGEKDRALAGPQEPPRRHVGWAASRFRRFDGDVDGDDLGVRQVVAQLLDATQVVGDRRPLPGEGHSDPTPAATVDPDDAYSATVPHTALTARLCDRRHGRFATPVEDPASRRCERSRGTA